MMRSLFSGVSGMSNHQLMMDVIGNNLANINTVGYKSGRVTFAEALAVTLQGASRPTETQGGINPNQIGLGMSVGNIDSNFGQGSLESTNVQTDLAINGEGFFILSDGQNRYYTRAGSFRFDGGGRLVNPADGKIVQGKLANENGEISSGTAVQDIKLPFGQKVAAKATEEVSFSGNLNAGQDPLSTILDSGEIYAIEEAGDNSDVNGLYAKGSANSVIRGLNSGFTTLTVNDGSTETVYTYVKSDTGGTNSDFHSLDDLITELNNDYATFTASLNSDGAIEITNNSGGDLNFSFSSDNSTLQAAFSPINGTLSDGNTTKGDEFSHVATKTDELTKLRNSLGVGLGLANSDTINIGAKVGGSSVSSTYTVTAASTLEDLTKSIKSALGISNLDAVKIDDDGSLKIKGDPGKSNEITSLAIRETGNDVFNTLTTFKELQSAKDITHTTSITVYDNLGESHLLTMEFKKSSNIDNQWEWTVSLGDNETISSGDNGTVSFNSDGSLGSIAYESGLTAFEFDPGTGADIMRVKFDMGKSNSFNGVTQFSSPSTTVAHSQDGYENGDLMNIDIDKTGKITGLFSNGVNQTLAQVSLAKFANPNGLYRQGNNMYTESANSGSGVAVIAGESIQSEIVPGKLEMSNVNLAEEFTNMIIAQRGFQANARVITSSDELLNELVNIKR